MEILRRNEGEIWKINGRNIEEMPEKYEVKRSSWQQSGWQENINDGIFILEEMEILITNEGEIWKIIGRNIEEYEVNDGLCILIEMEILRTNEGGIWKNNGRNIEETPEKYEVKRSSWQQSGW